MKETCNKQCIVITPTKITSTIVIVFIPTKMGLCPKITMM